MSIATLTCPVCNGTCRQAVDATGKPLGQLSEHPRWPQYAARGWMECRNCGGQTMSLTATGQDLSAARHRRALPA